MHKTRPSTNAVCLLSAYTYHNQHRGDATLNDFELVEKLRDYAKRLQKATKKKEKSDLLYLAAKDEDLQRLLKFLLDPHVVTGLSDKKIRQ